MDRQKILVIRFANELKHEELSKFRGAVIDAANCSSVLFHNHIDDGFRYSYPLIQYKRIGGCAALVCIGDGTEAIGEFFSNANFDVSLGDRKMHLEVANVDARQFIMQCWDDMFEYSLRKWMPLNQENYRKYIMLDSIVEKTEMLESLLTANILSFAKGLGISLEKPVSVNFTGIESHRTYLYKGVKMMGFDIDFKCNVSLPDFVGLGKGVSLGYGMVARRRDKRKEYNND